MTPELKLPMVIPQKGQSNGIVKVVLRKYLVEDTVFSIEYQYYFNITLRLKGEGKKSSEIPLPINVLVFCNSLDITEADFDEKIKDSKLPKKDEIVELDMGRIPSIPNFIQSLTKSGFLKLYKQTEASKGIIYAGTQFQHKTVKSPAYIIIDTTIASKAKLTVLGDKDQFIGSIFKNISDILSK